jgi:hypothetical protein
VKLNPFAPSFVVLLVLAASRSQAGARQASDATGGMQQVVEFARSGSFTVALARAESLTNPLERAQARLYVLHQAGDLAGALEAGLEGLRAAPADLWLLERVSYIAISLRSFEIAHEHVERFARALDSVDLSPSDRSRWRTILDDDRTQVESLATTAEARRQAARRARWTVALGAIALAAAMLALVRNGARSKRAVA